MSEIGTTNIISPAQVAGVLGVQTYDLKGSFRNFFNELSRLLKDYGDPKKDIIIDGTLIKADQKYGPYGTMVFENKVNTLEQVQTTLLNVFDALFKLEKSLTGLS